MSSAPYDRLQDVAEIPAVDSVWKLRDYRWLWATNVAAFCGKILIKMAVLQWLYEHTHSNMVLGGLGIIGLATQLPSILFGGVLADEIDRRTLVSSMQAVAAGACAVLWVLDAAGLLVPWHLYFVTGVLNISSRLEASARNALTPSIVPAALLQIAISTNVVTDNAGELLAPALFFVATRGHSLCPAFVLSTCAYAVAAVLPRLIQTDCRPQSLQSKEEPSQCGAVARARLRSCAEGLRYILHHPLLPGLYVLDWGMTVFTFYRELFPIFAATLLQSRPSWLSLRATVSLLTALNFAGGMSGSFCTFCMAADPFKGRQVLRATALYGAFCIAFGASPAWWLAALSVFGAGAADAVGMTVRKTIIGVSTPKHLQGRAAAGHSCAAQTANSLGQVYVAAACAVIGAGPTMVVGGCLTWAATATAAWAIPALLTHHLDDAAAQQ